MTLITLNFSPDMERAVMDGRKCCTTRNEQKGNVGDCFIVRHRLYQIIQVDGVSLYHASALWGAEGFASEMEFENAMREIYPELLKSSTVCLHFFAYVRDIGPGAGYKYE